MTPEKIAVIAGSGRLPVCIAEALKRTQVPYFVISILDERPDWVTDHPHAQIALGAVGDILNLLKQQGIHKIVFAGAVQRPSFSHLKLDTTAMKWLAAIGLKAFGDDGLFQGLVQQLAKEGIQVLGAQDILAELLTPKGLLAGENPSARDLQDIQRGVQILQALGAQDVGQAVVVEHGVVLGIEAAEGTDQLIQRCGVLKKTQNQAGVLVKMAKPDQETRIDLPTVGPRTFDLLKENGFAGVALEAGRSFILDQAACQKLAQASGLFITGIDAGDC